MRFFFLLLYLLNISYNSLANELELSEVISRTLKHHPQLYATRTQIDQAKARKLSADGGFDPLVSFKSLDFLEGDYGNSGFLDATVEQPTTLYGTKFIAGYRRSRGGLPSYHDQDITQDEGEVRAGFEVPILRDGVTDARRTEVALARIQQNIGNALVKQQEIELIRQASEAYYEWVASGEIVRIFNKLLQVTEERQKQLTEREKKGDLARFDVIDNERSVFQRQAQLVTAQRNLVQAKMKLSLFYRDQYGQPIIPQDDTLPKSFILKNYTIPASIENQFKKAIEQRPDLNRLLEIKNQQSLSLNLAENQLLPRLDAQVLASQDLGTRQEKLDQTELRAGLKFEYPLFNRTATGRKDILEAQLNETKFLIQFLKEKIQADINDVFNAIRQNFDKITISQKELQTAQEVEDGERVKFYQGDSNLIFVNLREQTTADSAVRVVNATLEFYRSLIALDAICANSAISQ